MKQRTKIISLAAVAAALAGCATMAPDYDKESMALMKRDFKTRGQATLSRLDQDELQATCSALSGAHPPKDVAQRLEAGQQALIKYPSNGILLGDWTKAEAIAQMGQGGQWSDDPKKPSGGNCYACHQLTRKEISYGNIGPSLYNYGKTRGNSPEVQKYTYSKIYNSQAFAACSNMPRFGHNGVLTEAQIKDLVAFLLDPKSPVNQ
ncbi:MAG TPA: sulfur oxidation c-type cytochrome SoxX [Usitatibacteraceae bacterium]|nr:sulfur oxidation c-type cytochrome SoxX [Usitatibacteraceae bacterium]